MSRQESRVQTDYKRSETLSTGLTRPLPIICCRADAPAVFDRMSFTGCSSGKLSRARERCFPTVINPALKRTYIISTGASIILFRRFLPYNRLPMFRLLDSRDTDTPDKERLDGKKYRFKVCRSGKDGGVPVPAPGGQSLLAPLRAPPQDKTPLRAPADNLSDIMRRRFSESRDFSSPVEIVALVQ